MEKDKFNFLTEQFDDIKILRYQVPAFGQLPLREKIFVYYLSQAALAGGMMIVSALVLIILRRRSKFN